MLPNLKTLRKKHNVSQQKLALAVNTSQQSINNYENNDIEPNIEMLKRIAIYFNVSIDYLVGRTFLEAPRPIDLSDEDMTLLRKYHTLKPDEIACVKHVIDTFANRN